MPKSPVSPQSPAEREPIPSDVDADEGAMEAEDTYLDWLQGGPDDES